ncbi:hypothetical protein CNMCM5793_000241 [Aspergillus hiratsukae]|uniref:Amino acid transporter transmembrane domain-containing protein n=1 Tax=Aspergillus hiratsukae TaxID=1194566 RepID=A0A8H6PYM3_9EURO|nr:hypothetical protein CNMCM5793_000241 [Aspergillus hiratsukae]KAF7163635.1 hypothetical protein CNMCM6106_000490 [Aspergillus hiratsukae]
MGSTLEAGSRSAADTDMDTDRVHPEPVSDGERDYEKQGPKPEYQDAFGDEEYAEVKYKTLSWWQCGFLMVAETVSLGILSLPAVVAALGLVPAVILLVALGLISTYTGYTIGQFKWRYPHIHSMADAGEVILGSFGRELFGTGQLLLVVFIMASHILTFTVAMNSITDHGTCSIVFGVVGLVISFVLCLPRTLAKVSFLSVASFISVFSAVLIVMVAVGVQRPWHGGVNATVDTSLYKAFLAVCNIVFSFSGHVAFFGFMAELKNPRDYPKSLFLLQGIDTCLYIVAAVVIYCYAGDDVTSPALGTASPIVKKVAYGIALPTIVIGGVVNGHVACKYIYVRMWRHSDRMHKRDLVATGSWVLIGLATWIVAWIIAEAIPVFNNLLSLVASLFASWFTYGFSALFWLYLNKGRFFSTPMKTVLTILNVFIMGIACCISALRGPFGRQRPAHVISDVSYPGPRVSARLHRRRPNLAPIRLGLLPLALRRDRPSPRLYRIVNIFQRQPTATAASSLSASPFPLFFKICAISLALYPFLTSWPPTPAPRGNLVLQRRVLVVMRPPNTGKRNRRSLGDCFHAKGPPTGTRPVRGSFAALALRARSATDGLFPP